jgi:hypothetical protein
VARVCVPVADCCHYSMVLGELVNIGILYRWLHQPLLFKKIIKFFFWLTSKFHIKLNSNFHIKLTLKKFEFSYQNKEKYQKKKFDWSLICWKKNLIGEYGGFWSEFDPYTDRNAYQIPIKFSYQIHIKLRSVCLVGLKLRTYVIGWSGASSAINLRYSGQIL